MLEYIFPDVIIYSEVVNNYIQNFMKRRLPVMSDATSFNKDEQAKIDQAVKDYQEKARQAEIDAAIRNAIMDAERQQPGKTGY